MTKTFRLCLLTSFVLLLLLPAFAGDDWLPVPKEDLQMKDYAAMPGQHAVILYRKVERSDKDGWEKNYVRIKILDDEGKKYANLETDSYPRWYTLDGLQARTIKPDGTIIPFTGKVFDKTVAKFKSIAFYAKSISIPDVQPGSIIEYRYTFHWETFYRVDSTWLLQQDLATRDADFALMMYQVPPGYEIEPFSLSWVTFYNSEDQPKQEKDKWIRFSVHNVPPLEKEDFSPPDSELQARVEFNYTEGDRPKTSDEYWNKASVKWSKETEERLNKQKAAQADLNSLVAASDAPEVKLKKIYDHVQKMRNLTYERVKSEKEAKNDKLKENKTIEDVLKHGYGDHNELNEAFVALARAAGFPATVIRVAERDQHFPHREVWKIRRFDTELAVVTVNGKQQFYDPGIPMCPFGILSWEDTGVKGLVLDRDKANWVDTPQPLPDETVERRVANMTMDSEGSLNGEVTISWEGRAALRRRLISREDDDEERKKDLEKVFKNLIGVGAKIELEKVDDWTAASDKFVVTAKVSMPGFATPTGKRFMLPISVFPGADNHVFTHARRVNPVYFRAPYKDVDEITVKVPDGLQVESLPKTRTMPTSFAELKLSADKDGQSIKIKREVTMTAYFFPVQYYPSLRDFLDRVKAVGDEQAVLHAAAK